jgi:ParB/RepB/Spo0J family partition protein
MAEVAKGVPQRISTSKISRNEENPRIVFDEGTLSELRESIRKVGILVPLTVYEEPRKGFVLLDGERRLRCAHDLGLSDVPAIIIDKPGPMENILRMFNIHMVRQQWSVIETAMALQRIIELTGDDRDTTLVQLTGLKLGRIRRYKLILSLPPKARQRMLDFEKTKGDKAKFSLMEEMLPVLRIIKRDYPPIWDKSDSGEKLVDAFISKYENRSITNVTHLRLLRKTLLSPAKGVNKKDVQRSFEKFLDSTTATLPELFDEVARQVYDLKGVIRDCERLADSLPSINVDALRPDDARNLRKAITELEKALVKAQKTLGDS